MTSIKSVMKPSSRVRVESSQSRFHVESSVFPDARQFLESVDITSNHPPQKSPRVVDGIPSTPDQMTRENSVVKTTPHDQLGLKTQTPREFGPYHSTKEHRGSTKDGAGGGLPPILSGTTGG